MKNKKAFALIVVIALLISFSLLSINIIKNRTYSNTLNKLKYLELQANIHMKHIKDNIVLNPNITINDDRFELVIDVEDINSSKVYHIYLRAVDDVNVRVYGVVGI